VSLERHDRLTESEYRDRVRGAIWGQFVGDAAALGTHWIYDLDERSRAFPDAATGFEKPRPGHYHEGKEPGDQTHYGDGALLLLGSIATHRGFDPRRFGSSFVATFRAGSYAGYLDHATVGTVERYDEFTREHAESEFDFQEGADDDQPATLTRLGVLVARYHHVPEADLLDLVQSLTLVAQNNVVALVSAEFSALLFTALFEGIGVENAITVATGGVGRTHPEQADLLRSWVRDARAAVDLDVTEATLRFGQSCPLEHSLPASLQVLLKYPDDYEEAIAATLRAGGDNAARAAIVGGWLGAHLGLEGIPEKWRARLTDAFRIADQVDTILADAEDTITTH
jgi:ADP-ribosyl-[dinitrogen reductase] hydrolase